MTESTQPDSCAEGVPMPGEAVKKTLLRQVAAYDQEIAFAEERRARAAANLEGENNNLAQLRSARAEIAQFLGEESAS